MDQEWIDTHPLYKHLPEPVIAVAIGLSMLGLMAMTFTLTVLGLLYVVHQLTGAGCI